MGIFDPILKISAKRGIARPHLPRLIKMGYTRVKALAWLKLKGFSYRWQDFLSDWRQILGIERKRDPLLSANKSKYPTSDILTPTYDELQMRFKAVYKVSAVSKDTKEPFEFFISIVNENMIKMGLWDELALVVAANEKYKYEYDIKSVSRDAIYERIEKF